MPNYDGSTEEPRLLPARLPFVLLNGASGIAVGLATEMPSHNLREVAAAAVALLKDDKLGDDELARCCPAPTIPAAARSSAPPRTSAPPTRPAAARSRCARAGRSRTWRAASGSSSSPSCRRDERAEGARGDRGADQPEGARRQEGAAAEQLQLKATLLAVLDAVRDESSKEAAVRLVFEPKIAHRPQQS
jgi:topoisomerase-4 subunit A